MTKSLFFLLPLLFAVFLGLPLKSHAQQSAPLEITAQETLEWHRDVREFIARGDVIATQGGNTLRAAKMTANYTEDGNGDFALQILRADTSVRIESEDGNATGDQVMYNVTTGKAELTGDNLKLETDTQTVTAEDKFVYDMNAGRLTATGNARAVQGEDVITADELAATFAETEGGETQGRALKTMEATGNVVITTPTETLTGNSGVYNKETEVAELTGNVTIKRGENILEGNRATVNLRTNVSTMFGGGGQDNGRVRGVFYPENDE